MTQESSSQGLQSTLQGFQMTVDQAERIVDVANEVANTAPIDTAGIFSALQRSSATLHGVGATYEEAVAMITAANSVVMDPDVVGTSFKTLATRYTKTASELQEMGEDAEGAAETTAKLRAELKALSGVDVLDSKGQFKGPFSLFDELADKWDSLDTLAQSRIGELLAGTRQRTVFNALMTNWDLAEKTLATAMAESTTGSATRELENWNKGIEASVEHFKASFQDMSQTVISSDFIKSIVDGGTVALDIFTNLVDTVGLLPTILGGGAIASFFKNFTSFASVAKVNDTVKALSGVSGATGILSFGANTSVVKSLDKLDNVGDVVQALSKANISDDIAKAAISSSKWAPRATEIADAMADAAISANAMSGFGNRIKGTFKTIGQSVKGIGQSLWAFGAANPLLAGAGIVATAAIGIYELKKYKDAQLVKQANEANTAWEATGSTIQEQIAKVIQLREAIDSGDLTDAQILENKQQILAIQQQITDAYSGQADGIDLVNGKLETQLNLLNNARSALAEEDINANYKAYEKSLDNMTKDIVYPLALGVNKSVADMVESLGIDGFNVFDNGDSTYSITFKGDATSAQEAINAYMNGLKGLEGAAVDTDFLLSQASEQLEKNAKLQEENAEAANGYRKRVMESKGGGKIYDDYKKSVEDLNNAYMSMDPQKVKEATEAYKGLSKEVGKYIVQDERNKLLGNDYYGLANLFNTPEFQIDVGLKRSFDINQLFTELANGSDAAVTALEKTDNQFASSAKSVGNYVDVIRKAELSEDKIKDIFEFSKPGLDAAPSVNALFGIADALNLIDENGKLIPNGIDMIISGLTLLSATAEESSAQIEESFSTASDTMERFAEYQSKVKSALDESTSATGLTKDSIESLTAAYKDLDSFNAERLFEKTTNGVHLNREELERLNSELEQSTLSDLYADLAQKREQLYAAKGQGADTSAIEQEIAACQNLIAQYEGMTSAYNAWQQAMSAPKERDSYEGVGSAYEGMKELVDQGWYDDPALQSYIDLMIAADRRTGDVVEDFGLLTQNIEGTNHSLMDYWQYQDGKLVSDGLISFLEDTNSLLGDEYAQLTENGWAFDFTGDKLQQVADKFGVTTDVIELFARALDDVGAVTFEENNILEDITAAQSYLKDMQKSGKLDSEIDLEFNAKTDSLESLQGTIESLKEERVNVDVEANPEAAGALDELINKCEQEYYLRLNYETGGALDTALADANRIYEIINGLPLSTTANIRAAVQGSSEVQSLASEIASLPPEVQIAIGVTEENVGSVEGIIGQFADQTINVGINYQSTGGISLESQSADGTINWKTGDVEKPTDLTAEGKINYGLGDTPPEVPDASGIANFGLGDSPQKVPDASGIANFTLGAHPTSAPDISGTANYTFGSVPTVLPPATQYVMRIPIGQKATGTMTSITQAHADGTMSNVVNLRPALVNGKVSLDENEIALVNEVGQESIIRNGRWMLLPPGMHQEALKKGDIVLSAAQTESLLRTGKALGTGRALASGTLSNAYVSGSQIRARTSTSGTIKNAAGTAVGSSASTASSVASSAASTAKSAASTAKSTGEAAKKADDFKETLDEIEILIDRVDRQIEHIERTAQGAYNTFTKRNSAINEELGVIAKQMDNAYAGYYKYLEKANSVGLSADWISKIQNGLVNIEDVGDEDTWKKIEEYRDWLSMPLYTVMYIEKLFNCWDTLKTANHNIRMKYA